MPWASFFFALVATPIIGGVFVASIFHAFMREGTGNFNRWDDKTIAERQVLSDQAQSINLPPNISPNSNGTLVGSDNHDGDCLTNSEETASNTDPRNPDTDGDWVDDCIEIANGTDPTDPNSGGVGPVTITDNPTPEPTNLYIVKLEKTVNGSHLTKVPVGSEVTFDIHIEAVLTGPEPRTLVLEDNLAGGFSFVEGTLDGQPFGTWTPTRQFDLPRPGSYSFDLNFRAKVIGNGILENTALTYEQENPLNQQRETAFVVSSTSPADQPPAPPIISFKKEVRATNSSQWGHYAFVKTNDTVEFRLVTQTNSSNIQLRDSLPTGLSYIPNTFKLFFNGQPQSISDILLRPIFNSTGYTLPSETGVYEIRFSAKVDTDSPFALTNEATANTDQSEELSSTATITSQP